MSKAPTFTAQVREELSRVQPRNRSEIRGELIGFLWLSGRVNLTRDSAALLISTTHAGWARKLLAMLRSVNPVGTRLTVLRSADGRGIRGYSLRIGTYERLVTLLRALGAAALSRALAADVLQGRGRQPLAKLAKLPNHVLRTRAAAKSCLRAWFAVVGHIHPPNRGYHLELRFRDRELAADCAALMAGIGLQPRVVANRGGHAVYLKDGDQIVHFLSMVGAHRAVLAYEDARVYREVRGRVNRLVNADTANVEKAVAAALRQVRDIELLVSAVGWENLPPALRQVAALRLRHRELSLRELGRQATPPLSKSAVAHRMRRLQQLAEAVRSRTGDETEPGTATDTGKT